MSEFARQCGTNAAVLSIFLISAAVFLYAAASAAIAVTRMLQLYIATNLAITSELNAIKHLMTVPGTQTSMNTTPASVPSPSPVPTQFMGNNQEGEIVEYNELEMFQQEEFRARQSARKAEGGMTDEDWQEQIEKEKRPDFRQNRYNIGHTTTG
jgi:hypothetical protein